MQTSDLSRGEPWRDRAASPGTPRSRPLALSRRAREAGRGCLGISGNLLDVTRIGGSMLLNEQAREAQARISMLRLDWRDFQEDADRAFELIKLHVRIVAKIARHRCVKSSLVTSLGNVGHQRGELPTAREPAIDLAR